MKSILFALIVFLPLSIFCQINTENKINNEEVVVFILPHNVLPNGSLFTYGPPNPKIHGRSMLIELKDGTTLIIKTIVEISQSEKEEEVFQVYKIMDGASELVEHNLTIEKSLELSNDKMKTIKITGLLADELELDLTFQAYLKHDLKNSYFLDFMDEKGFKVKMDMKQTLK